MGLVVSRVITRLLFLGLFFSFLVLGFVPVQGLTEMQTLISVSGQVVEASTELPIENVTVAFWKGKVLDQKVITNFDGYYETVLDGESGYTVYAYCDNPDTLGFDYVPSKQSLWPLWRPNVTFQLIQGASIMVEGDIRTVSVTSPSTEFIFEVKDPQSGVTLNQDNFLLIYGTSKSSQNSFLSLDSRHLIVPAMMDVTIEATVTFRETITETRPGRRWTTYQSSSYFNRTFPLDKTGHFTLSQGQVLHLDIRNFTLSQDLRQVEDVLCSLDESIDEMDSNGFYTLTEKRDVAQLTDLWEEGGLMKDQGLYEESFADLREAYVRALSLDARLKGMMADAKTSAVILIFFLAFTDTAVSHLFEKQIKKLTATFTFYPALLVALYVVYPGCHLIPTILFVGIAIASLSVVLFLTYLLPTFLQEGAVKQGIALRSAIVEFFSLAKRNLKRRRLRFLLTLSTVTIMVMSFVVLTSFSLHYGLVVRPQHFIEAPTNGLMVRQSPPQLDPEAVQFELAVRPTFTPFNLLDLEWLLRKPNTSLVSPKAENYPTLSMLGNLGLLPLRGCLGILPSVETQFTHINGTIVEGRYLQDDDQYAVLVSTSAIKEYNLKIGTTLFLTVGPKSVAMELIGAFDDDLLAQITDLDGMSILPQTLWLGFSEPGQNPVIHLSYCAPSEVAIIPYKTALDFQDVYLSRLNVVPTTPEATSNLARQLALERDLMVYVTTEGQSYLTYLGLVYEWKGFPVLIPYAIVILTVVVVMLNALYERRREISILSSIGLNPSHITWLFLSEAAVIGLIGGGIGYLLGLGWYPVMSAFSVNLEVRQKVSVVWCVGALCVALTAVLIGAVTALKSSTVVTPSLIRRWRLKKENKPVGKPWALEIPIRVFPKDVNHFVDYVQTSLRANQKLARMPNVELVQTEEEETSQSSIKRIKFVYPGDPPTSNELVATRKKGAEMYSVNLISRGEMRGVQETSSLIREIVIHWNVERKSGS